MTTAELHFKDVVHNLIDNGIYPGPTAINRGLVKWKGKTRSRRLNTLNGRETKWRREVMKERKVGLLRPPE